ncbi:hypothetical protein [Paenibacillus whitsoniae]|uniref:hypothetical protein n=1 Tax=Paenibacillus whitsoniae TaxID=2496558 RepID=UPI0013DE9649|nr:hypothetical protein [Paenibacillus whitsoniae]
MDPIIIILLGVVAIYLLIRLRHSFRKVKGSMDRTEDIQRQLARLRKKRDED